MLIFLSGLLYAQDNAEIPYSGDKGDLWREIRDLTREKQNNLALEKLTLFIQLYPNDFDRAYVEIEKILEAKNRFYYLADRLIKSCEENPEDSETPVKLLEEMELLERNPDEDTKKLITTLKGLHQFKYYNFLADGIQKEAEELAKNGNIFNTDKRDDFLPDVYALDKLVEGFSKFPLYESDFNTEWKVKNPEYITQVYQILDKIKQCIDSLEDADFHDEFEKLVIKFIDSVNENDLHKAQVTLSELNPYFNTYSKVRNEIKVLGTQINELYISQKDSAEELSDASFIPFMRRLILGKNTSSKSGIISILDNKYESYVHSMVYAVSEKVKGIGNEYYAFLPDSFLTTNFNYAPIYDTSIYISPIRRYASLTDSVFGYYELLDDYDNSPNQVYIFALDYLENISEKMITIAKISENINSEESTQKNVLTRFDKEQNNPNFNQTDYVKYLFNSVARMNLITGEKTIYDIRKNDWFKNYESVSEEKKQSTLDFDDFTKKYEKYVDEVFNLTEKKVIDSWQRITRSYKKTANVYITNLSPYIKQNDFYNIGMDDRISSTDYARINNNPKQLVKYAEERKSTPDGLFRYPNFTIQISDYIKQTCDEYISNINRNEQVIDETLASYVDWKDNQEILKIIDQTKLVLDNKKEELRKIKENADKPYQKALENQKEFRYAKNNADSLFEESEQAYENGEFDKAERLLMSASEQYAEALSYQDDAVLRTQIDNAKFELSSKIANAKNEIVVRESRELYTKAKNAYNTDLFDDAEKYILAARNKWAETHDEENIEFETFWQLINTAVSMKTGRILLPSDPLYAEMSQILSSASLHYDSAVELFEKGDKKNGNEELNKAREDVVKIKNVYPLNEETSLLLLKIEKIQNPKLFEQTLDQKIDDARALCYIAGKQMEGYNALVNYYNLDPDYKNLKTIIYNVEIDLGMRQKPVDNSAITKANRLLKEAQQLFDRAGTNQDRLNEALKKVDQVLALNPNNKNAELLKDKIATKKGSSTIIVLSSDDEILLSRAKNALTAGRIEDANVYMLQILQNPQNIKVKSVSDLKKRIESRL